MKYSKQVQQELFKISKILLDREVTGEHIEELRKVLIFHEWKYYIENDPIISDFEYDLLFQKLKDLESKSPELVTPDSPTQRVSNDLVETFNSVTHITPMLSLDNSYNADDLIDFDKQVKKLCELHESERIQYSIEPKFDGGSIAIVYENDYLLRAATRGNGLQGEEMTANARSLPSLPLKADFSKYGINTAEVRGEAVIRKDIFEKINLKREKQGKLLFANPRNAATGGLRMKDPNKTRNRGIEVFLFQLSYAVNEAGEDQLMRYNSHNRKLEMLRELGFKVPRRAIKLCVGIQEVIEFTKDIEINRESFPYEIDGMVVKVDNRELQLRCGATTHHPRWAIAYKFKAKQASTKLLSVEYQVGKIGSITPVAKLKPIQLAGVTVSSVSLHNEEFILSKDLRIGDTVLVERAGDVIPYIVKSFPELREGHEQKIIFPKYCPVNTYEKPVTLEKSEGEAAWRCPDCLCGLQDLQRVIFHVSKDAMDIDGFGKSYVERFFELGWIHDISDVYNLDYENIASLEGFGSRSAGNLRRSIEQARQNPIYRLLHSLSIHHLGKKASKLLAERINHVLDLQSWEVEDFLDIKDIGPVVAKNVMDYFKLEKNIEMLRRMEERGVNLFQTNDDKPLEMDADLPFFNKSILFTGTLEKLGRKEAQKMAELAGAKNLSAVSRNLDILVVGKNAGSKLKKARALETVEIISEDEFIKRINH